MTYVELVLLSLTLIAAVVAAVWAVESVKVSRRQLEIAETDTDIHVNFADRTGDRLNPSPGPQYYDGDEVRLGVTNRGGTPSPSGSFLRITTDFPSLEPSDDWLPDESADPEMPAGSRAWRWELPQVSSNKLFYTPSITVRNDQGSRHGRLSWEVWLKKPDGGFRGGNAARTSFSVTKL